MYNTLWLSHSHGQSTYSPAIQPPLAIISHNLFYSVPNILTGHPFHPYHWLGIMSISPMNFLVFLLIPVIFLIIPIKPSYIHNIHKS